MTAHLDNAKDLKRRAENLEHEIAQLLGRTSPRKDARKVSTRSMRVIDGTTRPSTNHVGSLRGILATLKLDLKYATAWSGVERNEPPIEECFLNDSMFMAAFAKAVESQLGSLLTETLKIINAGAVTAFQLAEQEHESTKKAIEALRSGFKEEDYASVRG